MDEKYDLAKLMAEIEEDEAHAARDIEQQTDIPQSVITELMMEKFKQKKKE